MKHSIVSNRGVWTAAAASAVLSAATLAGMPVAAAAGASITDLGELWPVAISGTGDVGGTISVAGERHAACWSGGSLTDLGTLGGRSDVRDVSRIGQMAGVSLLSKPRPRWTPHAGFLLTPEDTDGDLAPDLWYRDDDENGINDLMLRLDAVPSTMANAVNDRGVVVGSAARTDYGSWAYVWEPAGGRRLQSPDPYCFTSREWAVDVNNAGHIVGNGIGGGPDACGQRAILWRVSMGREIAVDLGTLGGSWSRATAVNELGQIIGKSGTAGGGVNGFLLDPADTDGDSALDVWYRDNDGDGANDLMTALGQIEVVAINDLGHVIGNRYTEWPNQRAFRWTTEGGLEDLGTLGGPSSRATGVDNFGQIVGSSTLASYSGDCWLETPCDDVRAFVWTTERGIEDLGTLGGNYSGITAINDNGRAVGHSTDALGELRGALWSIDVTTENCFFNLRDDDGDGATDCLDSDCAGQAFCQPGFPRPFIPGGLP